MIHEFILIFVFIQILNSTKWIWEFFIVILSRLIFKNFNYIKINIFYKKKIIIYYVEKLGSNLKLKCKSKEFEYEIQLLFHLFDIT